MIRVLQARPLGLLHSQVRLLNTLDSTPPQKTKNSGSHHTLCRTLHMLKRALAPARKKTDIVLDVAVRTMSSHCSVGVVGEGARHAEAAFRSRFTGHFAHGQKSLPNGQRT